MSSGQNSSIPDQSQAEEKRSKNKIAVRKHRAAQKEEDEKREAEIQRYKEENMKLENSIRVMRAEGELFRSFVEAHDLASGGEFSRTPEGSQLIENISKILTEPGPGERKQERREEGTTGDRRNT